ncbi:MAG: dihydrolipoyl dehydrogenase [Synergistaceae bacterium]|jgi:dihydrolipoamide dehydrogenase|nr:dihydrolipoyl dehydrogenase [Synergistaceae bacterium]
MGKRIVVIGGGPGGYVAAIRAAQLGAAVTLVEKGSLGGTCLNVGCIPTKVLLHSAELYSAVKNEGPSIGILAEGVRFDWAAIQKRKASVVSQLVGGVGVLLKSNGVDRVTGEAKLTSPRTVEAGGRVIEADAIVIATGSVPSVPPIKGLAIGGNVITSDGALSLPSLPGSIAIAGGGVIGVEFASVFSSFGVSVTVVEMLPQILPNIDSEIAAVLRAALEAKGVVFHTGAKLNSVESDGSSVSLDVGTESGPIKLNVDTLLVATGRRPSAPDMGTAGVDVQRGRIVVNEYMETSVPGIYAIGDCASPIMLAHVASREGEIAVENAMGAREKMEYKTVPSAIYTSPAAASVGLSEDAARKAGHKVKVGRFPLSANGKSVIAGDAGGLIKIVADERYDEVLGVHILGGPATDMIAEAGLALRLEATIDEIVTTIHAHPTVSEAMGEAALAALGRAIHMPKKQ